MPTRPADVKFIGRGSTSQRRKMPDRCWGERVSQTRTVKSPDADTSRMPSGAKASAWTYALVAAQFGHFVTGRHVPQTNRVVLTAGAQSRAVRAEGDRIHDARVWQDGERLERAGIPEPDRAVMGCGGEETAVHAEGDGGDGITMAGQTGERLAGGGIPDADGLVEARGDQTPAVGSEADGEHAVGMAGQGAERVAAFGRRGGARCNPLSDLERHFRAPPPPTGRPD